MAPQFANVNPLAGIMAGRKAGDEASASQMMTAARLQSIKASQQGQVRADAAEDRNVTEHDWGKAKHDQDIISAGTRETRAVEAGKRAETAHDWAGQDRTSKQAKDKVAAIQSGNRDLWDTFKLTSQEIEAGEHYRGDMLIKSYLEPYKGNPVQHQQALDILKADMKSTIDAGGEAEQDNFQNLLQYHGIEIVSPVAKAEIEDRKMRSKERVAAIGAASRFAKKRDQFGTETPDPSMIGPSYRAFMSAGQAPPASTSAPEGQPRPPVVEEAINAGEDVQFVPGKGWKWQRKNPGPGQGKWASVNLGG